MAGGTAKSGDSGDLYAILGLEPAADVKHVARAYKKKSLLHHPDRGGDGVLDACCFARGSKRVDGWVCGWVVC